MNDTINTAAKPFAATPFAARPFAAKCAAAFGPEGHTAMGKEA